MKRASLLTTLSALAAVCLTSAIPLRGETVSIDGVDYELNRLIERQVGPGVTYLRLQLPELPLNVNLTIVDMTNEYVSVENHSANEKAKGTEKIATMVSRLTTDGHRAIVGQNANFWAVSSQQPDGKLFASQTRNVSISQGQMVTECNMSHEIAFGGPVDYTGLLAITPDKEVWVDFCKPSIVVRINDGIALYTVAQCNKGVHSNEIAMYNRFYGTATAFRPIADELADGYYQLADGGDATELILDLADGEEWLGGEFIDFTVKEVRTNAGTGVLGDHDLALVGRGNGVVKLAGVNVGDKVSLRYAFQFAPNDAPASPLVETAIGGNLLMMRQGEVQSLCGVGSYDYTTYPRSLYGTSAARDTLFMMVIDKSTDPTYGKSAGLSTARAAQLARHFGCTNMLQCDGGGSAQMYVTDGVVNKTTESAPRAVANALLVFDNAPASSVAAALAIDTPGTVIELPCATDYTPAVLAYTQYGSLIGGIANGYELSCSGGIGTIDGRTLITSATPAYGTLTASYGGVSVTRPVSVGGAVSAIGGIADDPFAASLRCFPAVAGCGGSITLKCPQMTAVELYAASGRCLLRRELPTAASCTIDAPAAAGVYIVVATTPQGRASTRLLVR